MINILPTPKICKQDGESVSKFTPAIYTTNSGWVMLCEIFCSDFELITGFLPEYGKGGIQLEFDSTVRSDGYVIDSTDDGIRAKASSNEGILYALSSLLQILKIEGGYMTCSKAHIEDYPDKDYRSMMVDLGREWHPAETLYKYIDVCYMYKVKYLHLHFCDTDLYTLPSKAFPKLNTEGKYYSYDDIEGLNLYAMQRGVILIPEFECPGHAPILNKHYPEIFSDKFESTVTSDYKNEAGLAIDTDHLLCAGSEVCFEATKTLIKETCDMFPDAPYINIGGDEAAIALWNECSVCKNYMLKHGIKDERELYCDYLARITDYVFTLGKIPIVWEGFPKEGSDKISKDTIVIAWESLYQPAPDLLESGFRVINASWKPLYIVSPYSLPNADLRWNETDILKWNVYNWQNWWDQSEAYLNPITVEATDRVMGAMLCAWEQTYEQEINKIVENLAAMAERTWNARRVCTDVEYMSKMKTLHMRVARFIQQR